MKDYLIYMDVSGDVEKAYLAQNNVKLVPMNFTIEKNEYLYTDGEGGLSAEDFYVFVKQKKTMTTSQITPAHYEEFFEGVLAEGKSVLYLALSSGLSSTYSAAKVAQVMLKEKYPDVDFVPVDSLVATGPQGILLERMVENKKKGLDIFQNAADIEAYRKNVKGFTYVDDLQALKRGGRISAATAVIGGMLNIKPIIKITPDGKLESFAKGHGLIKTQKKMVEIMKEHITSEEGSVVYITDAAETEASAKLEKLILEACPHVVVKRRILSPIIGAHLGTGAIVIGFVAKEGSNF